MSNQVRELEKRIEALEQEVQLLNVQIKHTLLEIQERLLNGAYPALQSNDISPTPEQPLPVAAPTAPQKKTTGQSQISRIRLDDAGQVTEVEAPAVKPIAQVQPAPVAPKKAESLQSLETWMLKKVQEVGAARTRRLIEIYAQNGQISASSARALEELLKVYDEPQPEKPSRRTGAASHEIPPLPEAIRRAVEYESSAPKSTRNKAVTGSASSARPPTAPRSGASKTQAMRSPSVSTPVQAQTPEQPSNVVLRLIAGVQSAGIGITRRKSHG